MKHRILAASLSRPLRDVGVFEIDGGSIFRIAGARRRASAVDPIDLSSMIFEVLRRARLRGDQIDLYAATLGPGETPDAVLEPALEALQGLALGFERPLVLISSLEALAHSVLDTLAHSIRGSTRDARSLFSARVRAVNENRRHRLRVMPVLSCQGRTAVGIYAFDRGRLVRVEERIVARQVHAPHDAIVVGEVAAPPSQRAAAHPDAPRALDVARAAAARPRPPFRAREIASLEVRS
jgi:hypothetical protein